MNRIVGISKFAALAGSLLSIAITAGLLFGCPSWKLLCGDNALPLEWPFPMPFALVASIISDTYFSNSKLATLVIFSLFATTGIALLYLLWRKLESAWKFLAAYLVISAACYFAAEAVMLKVISPKIEAVESVTSRA